MIDRFSYEILQILLPGHCCQDKLDSSVVSDLKIWDLHKMNRMVQLVEELPSRVNEAGVIHHVD